MSRKIINVDINNWPEGNSLSMIQFDHMWKLAYSHLARIPFATRIARILVKDSVLTISQLLEKAISRKGGLKRIPGKGKDYSDNSDAKFATARISSKQSSYSARISNIHCKTGYLRVMIHERMFNKFYYFLIPYDGYKPYTYKRGSEITNPDAGIEIPFNLDGSPRRENHWWAKYEVSSFQEICVPVVNKIN